MSDTSVSLDVGRVDAATKTALHLREYDDIIDPVEIYSLLGKQYKYIPCIHIHTLCTDVQFDNSRQGQRI